jgi:hypothetical protein
MNENSTPAIPRTNSSRTNSSSDACDLVPANSILLQGRRRFLKVFGTAGLFALSPAIASAATKKAPVKKAPLKKAKVTAALKAVAPTPTTPPATALVTTTTAAASVPAVSVTSAPPTAVTPKVALASGPAFDLTKELLVNFTFVGTGGGVIRNPFVAVWIEDAAGQMVRTVNLNFQKANNGNGLRWIPDLKRWYRSEQARLGSGGADVLEQISSATRIPGAYSVAWDGRDQAGEPVKQGAYNLFVEAAREDGPYQFVTAALTVGSSPFVKDIADNGELQKVSARLKARA